MGFGDKLAQLLLAALRPQVDADALLVAVQAGEVAVADLPRDLALRRLDLDDFGAEIGQQHGGVRSGEHDARFEDADAREWPAVGHRIALASSAITSRVRYFDATNSSRLLPIGSSRTDRSVTPASANCRKRA